MSLWHTQDPIRRFLLSSLPSTAILAQNPVGYSGPKGQVGAARAKRVGRIKLHLNHIKWSSVEKADGAGKPIRVTLALTNAKGKPVMASVRPDVAKWELP